ncbi:MAG: ABC transporter permease [Phycisphaerales bacterium JB050]
MSIGALRVLIVREFVRMLRQPTRIVATLGTAALFWLLAASGFSGSVDLPGAENGSYSAYLLPGIALMVVMFGTIFGAIGLIQDRHSGFLQSVLVSPVSLWVVAVSKLAPAAALATVQGIAVLAGVFMIGGVETGFLDFVLASFALLCGAVGVLSVGLALAWRIDSVTGFHGVMNILLLPAWVLSGAMFPVDGASSWLSGFMQVNPLHWIHRCTSDGLGIAGSAGLLAWVITIAFPLVTTGLLLATIRRSGGRRGAGEG